METFETSDEEAGPVIYTVGHSTLPISVFIELLKVHGVQMVADVRSVPGSRRNPQFNREALAASLGEDGIEYVHMSGLGGFRKPVPGSVNTGWRNSAFRGYADYMSTPRFDESLESLASAARSRTVAVMCSEAVPWRCHRSLIADALLVRGFRVLEIIGRREVRPHRLTSFARVEETRITYPEGP